MPSNFENGFGVQIREWELGPNSTIYDSSRAAPTNQALHVQWIVFVALLVTSVVFMMAVYLAILLDKKSRKNVFNTYILFLMPGDILFGVLCAITCALNLSSANGQFYSLASCKFQSFYVIFIFSSSCWLNAIVAYQLHCLLTYSQRAMRYQAPTRRRVAQHALGVYAWAIFVGSWVLWTDQQWWPISAGLYSGSFCLPMAYDKTSLVFLYAVFAPCGFLLPCCYVCYVTIDILRKGLLPPREKRQNFMVFLRIVVVYFLITIPGFSLAILGHHFGPWWTFGGGLWGHLQGPISAGITLLKPDVTRAFKKLVCCGGRDHESSQALERPEISRTKSKSSSSWVHPSVLSISFSGTHNEIHGENGDDVKNGKEEDEETPPDLIVSKETINGTEEGRIVRADESNQQEISSNGDHEDVPRSSIKVNMAGQIINSQSS